MLPPLLADLVDQGHQAYDGGHAYNLNILGIRTNNRDQTADAFDDWITCTYREEKNGRWVTKWWQATTDPGKQALLHPELYNAKGVDHGLRPVSGGLCFGLALKQIRSTRAAWAESNKHLSRQRS